MIVESYKEDLSERPRENRQVGVEDDWGVLQGRLKCKRKRT